MALRPLYLVDKSASTRMAHTSVSARLGPLLLHGRVATCPIIDLELLYSARSHTDYEAILTEREAMPSFPLNEEVTQRAIDVQHQLARLGHHRLPIPDLLVAATAEVHDLAVVHYDTDFDRIASVTGQAAEWVAPRGSL